jgi:hypothetical protein
MPNFNLISGTSSLSFMVGDNDWTRVVFSQNGNRHELGADVLKIIISRLANALQGPDKLAVSSTSEGHELRWVLSLMECHHSMYLKLLNEGLEIYIQDGLGAMIGTISLSDADRIAWLEILQRCPLT